MKTSEILIAAKALIENPENWIRGDYARSAPYRNDSIYGNDPDATCFCSVGALQRINNSISNYSTELRYLNEVAGDIYGRGVVHVNDECSHENVMRLWDEAIKLAKADEDKLRSE